MPEDKLDWAILISWPLENNPHNAPENRMNPDTADLIHDREETEAFRYSARVANKTAEILEDLDLMNDALGDFGCEFGSTGIAMIIRRAHRSVVSQYEMSRVIDELNEHSRSIAEWYAKRLIAAEEKINVRHPIPRREAD